MTVRSRMSSRWSPARSRSGRVSASTKNRKNSWNVAWINALLVTIRETDESLHSSREVHPVNRQLWKPDFQTHSRLGPCGRLVQLLGWWVQPRVAVTNSSCRNHYPTPNSMNLSQCETNKFSKLQKANSRTLKWCTLSANLYITYFIIHLSEFQH